MAARKLILHLMVLSPIFLLGSIAVESRYGGEPYDEDPVVPAQQQRVSAYIELVRLERQVLGATMAPDPTAVRDLARHWIIGGESGRLDSLPPSHFDDTPRDGARGQIYDSRNKMLRAVQQLAQFEAQSGNYDQAAADCLLALRACETMKYSDLYTVGTSTLDQRTLLTWIESLLPNLGEQALHDVRRYAADVLARQQPLDKIIARCRQQFVEASRNRGLPRLSIEEVQQLASIEGMLGSESSPKLVIHELKNSLVAARGEAMPMFLSTVKMGLQSQELLREKLVRVASQ